MKSDNILSNLALSNYVTLSVTVPETHADAIRDAIDQAGGGKFDNYSYCSFSIKGIGRFKPTKDAQPFIGTTSTIEQVIEEKIETVCSTDCLEQVIEAIKQAHPYEATTIDIYPVYKIGCKLPLKK